MMLLQRLWGWHLMGLLWSLVLGFAALLIGMIPGTWYQAEQEVPPAVELYEKVMGYVLSVPLLTGTYCLVALSALWASMLLLGIYTKAVEPLK